MTAPLELMKTTTWLTQEAKITPESLKLLEKDLITQVSRVKVEHPWVIQRIERWPMGTWSTGLVLGCASGLQFRSSLPSELTLLFDSGQWCLNCCRTAHSSDEECPEITMDGSLVEQKDTISPTQGIKHELESCRREEHVVYLATLGNRMWVGTACQGNEWNPWHPVQQLVEEGADLAVVFQSEDPLFLDDALELQAQLSKELGVPTKLSPRVQVKALMEHPRSLQPELAALMDYVTWARPDLNALFVHDFSEEGMDSRFLTRREVVKVLEQDPDLTIVMQPDHLKCLVGMVEMVKGQWLLLDTDGWLQLIWLPAILGKGILDFELG